MLKAKLLLFHENTTHGVISIIVVRAEGFGYGDLAARLFLDKITTIR